MVKHSCFLGTLSLKSMAKKTKKSVESPFVAPPTFDYETHRDQTTVAAVKAIFKILGENAEGLSYTSKDTKETILEHEDKVVGQMLQAIIDNNVPSGDMQTLIDTFTVVLQRLFQNIARIKNEYEREFLARSLEGRNPGDGHYSREYSTLGDLFKGLGKIRTAQKDDPKGYFYITKKTE